MGNPPPIHHGLGDDPFVAVNLGGHQLRLTPGIAQQVADLPPIPPAPRRGRNRQPAQINAAAGPSRLPAVVKIHFYYLYINFRTNSIKPPAPAPAVQNNNNPGLANVVTACSLDFEFCD